MTQHQAWRSWVAVPLMALGSVVTLLAQLPAFASKQNFVPLITWFEFSVLGLILLIVGAFADRGGRLLGLVLISIALLINILTAQHLFDYYKTPDC